MNIKKNKYLVLFITILIFGIYFFGFYNGIKRTFPYKILSNINKDIKKIINKKTIELSKIDKSNCSTNEIFQCFKLPKAISFNNSSDLNNFIFDWQKIEVNNLKKLAYFKFETDKIFYLNQDDEKFLSKINLNEKNFDNAINGGIKQIFQMNDKYYAYVGYSNKDCTLLSIFEFPNGKKITDFPCLPAEFDQLDLNNTGGAFLEYNNLNFLTTGTPTTFNKKINDLAQDDDSPYGKVLTIEIDEKNNFNYKIFSKGHRNPQGISLIDDKIFSVEHGPRGGDELNIIYKNENYGWPLFSLGSTYELDEIPNGNLSNNEFFREPIFSFTPSIATSSIEKCPNLYQQYYKPYKCIAISSLRTNAIYLVLMSDNLDKVINYEKIEFESRIRKFKFYDDLLVAGTDYHGVIIGKISKLTNN